MKLVPFLIGLAVCFGTPYSLPAQTETTVCEILSNPESFNGKIVKIKAVVITGYEEFELKGSNCNQMVNSIWLSYPEGAGGKAGPAAFLGLELAKNSPKSEAMPRRTPVKLEKNKEFKSFDSLLATPAKVNGICLGCNKFSVTATLVGRLDGVKEAGLIRDAGGKVTGLSGFGNLSRYKARLVLQSVSEISSQEIDYAQRVAPAESAPATAGTYTPGPPSADTLKRAAAAFGAQGESNGVTVGFGGANEVPKYEATKSNSNSPDGILFHALYDSERLKGAAMDLSIAHDGNHIAHIRSTQTGISDLIPYGAAFRAWQTTLISAISNKVKTLELAGGYTV
jgi:hypothetical protein